MVAHGCQCGERPCPVRMETMSNSWVLMIELQLHQNWGHFYSLLLKGCALLLLSACLPIEAISRHLVSTKVESKANSWLMITGLPLGYLMDNHNPWETVWNQPTWGADISKRLVHNNCRDPWNRRIGRMWLPWWGSYILTGLWVFAR